jgi:hypothetical protein
LPFNDGGLFPCTPSLCIRQLISGGLLCFFFIGLLEHTVANLNDKPIPAQHPVVGLAVYGIVALVAWAAGVVGTLAGAFIGIVIANHLWWRFVASSDERTACLQPHGWLAFPPALQVLFSRKK